ncbi:MAG: hypothetical protein KJO82_11335, partial [Gammaproteobacteria bacterium]|nr:hypothetical protein [Gammaproteobacteria bacterium]
MSTKLRSLKIAAISAAWTCALIAPGSTLAAPGTLSDSPLFLTNPVEPNILFLLDDSGSMDWGTMTPENNGIINLGCPYYYTQPAPDNDFFTMVPNEAGLAGQGVAAPFGGVWRAWSSSYNRLYYDPNVTYTPWSGANNAGVPFGDVNPAAALLDPYNPAAGNMNLTALQGYWSHYCQGGLGWFWINNFYMPHYYTWSDTNGDNIVDPTDAHVLVEIRPATPVYFGRPNRTDCAARPACTYAEEIQNFANWFSYYRKREFVAKAAYGQVIGGASNTRMGLVTLHNNNNVNESIASMNDDPFTGEKEELLDELYQMAGAGGTPLRNAFDNAGRYLSCEGNAFFGSCPALSDANGGECQQNFTIMMTDGFYNGGFGGLGNTDGDNDTPWDSGNAGPYGDGESNTLGDIAMEYYEDDIRPGTANNLTPPPGGVDENTAQHMVTYSVAFGVSGTVTAMPPNDTDPFAWPTPNTDPRRIDDLRHAAWNGRGDFYSAQDPTELITGLRGALTSIQSRIGSSASVAFNTGSLITNSEVYLALFNSERWNGDLLAFDLDPNTGAITSVPSWSA